MFLKTANINRVPDWSPLGLFGIRGIRKHTERVWGSGSRLLLGQPVVATSVRAPHRPHPACPSWAGGPPSVQTLGGGGRVAGARPRPAGLTDPQVCRGLT